MNRYVIFLILFFVGLSSFQSADAQKYYDRTNGQTTPVDPHLGTTLSFKIPVLADTSTALTKAGIDSCGIIFKELLSGKVWIRDTVIGGGRKWTQIGSSSGITNITGLITAGTNVTLGGAGTSASPYIINASGSGGGGGANVNLGAGYRIAFPGTNNVRTIFPASGIIIDSTSNTNGLTFKADTSLLATQYDISLKLNKTDTSSMLSAYLHSALGVKYTDTATMLASYLRSALGLKFTDTISTVATQYWVTTHTSGSNKVDTIYRTAGKDSIQFTINGRYHSILDSLGSGGGGSQTLPQVLSTGRTLSASDSILIAALNSLHLKGIIQTDTVRSFVTDTVKPSQDITFLGTSITAGSGATNISRCYATLDAARLGLTVNNRGHGGYVLSKAPGSSLSSELDVYMTDIPTKTSAHKYLVSAWGENDANAAAQYCCTIFDYSTARFTAAYHTIIDYAKSVGWDSTNIIIMSPFWQLITRTDSVHQDSLFTASQQVAAFYHCKFIDNFHLGQYYSGRYFFDNIHPADYGHELIANNIVYYLDSINTVKFNNQNLAVNGSTDLRKLNLRISNDTMTGTTALVGVQPGGNAVYVPGNAYVKLQGNDTIYQAGNTSIRGNYVSLGYGQFQGATFSGQVGTVTGHGSNLITGIFGGVGYVDALSNAGGAFGIQISPFGAKNSISGFVNTSEVARVQLFGGTYMQSFAKIDSGTMSSLQPYRIETNGTDIEWNDKTGQPHRLSGSVQLLYSAQAGTLNSVSNTTTETAITASGTNIGTLTLPINFFSPGRSARFKIHALIATTTVPGNLTINIKLGSTVIGTGVITNLTGSLSGSSSNRIDITGEITCATAGTTGSVVCSGGADYSSTTTGTKNTVWLDNFSGTTVNTGATQVFGITVQWATASSGNSFNPVIFYLEQL